MTDDAAGGPALDAIQVATLEVDDRGVIISVDAPGDGSLQLLRSSCGRPLSEVIKLEGAPARVVAGHLRGGDKIAVSVQGRIVVVLRIDAEVLDRHAAAQVRLRTILGSVIAGFAHEVRNPLAALASLIESASVLPGVPEEAVELLGKVPNLVSRIEGLIRLALSYGRPTRPSAAWHQLGALVDRVIDAMTLGGTPTLGLVVDDTLARTPVLADAGHVTSILSNLLSNALQAASSPSQVQVTACSGLSDGQTGLEVRDDGRGVASELRERIFEPFFTTKAKGTGLGLALARDLARMNGGDVVLVHTSAQGSTFRLVLRGRSVELVRN